MSNVFQDIKDRVDLRELVRYYGLDVNRGGFAICHFHNERTPSFKVYEDHFHCFGCGAHGDHIDFVQKMYGETNIEAAKRISSDFRLIPPSETPSHHCAAVPSSRKILTASNTASDEAR